MCICTMAFVEETDLFSPNEWRIIFSKEDLWRDKVLDKATEGYWITPVDSQSVFLHNDFGHYNEIVY